MDAYPTAQEFAELHAQAKAGDRRALERMIAGVSPLVRRKATELAGYIVRRHGWAILEPDDLFQVGLLGVFVAVPEWRPSRGKWTSFAGTCARNAMLKEIGQIVPVCVFSAIGPEDWPAYDPEDKAEPDQARALDARTLLESVADPLDKLALAQWAGFHDRPLTVREIGKKWGVSGARIGQRLQKALKGLKRRARVNA